MQIVVVENYEEMSKQAARLVEQQLQRNKASVLGLATGSSPIGLYRELITSYQAGLLSFEDVQSINLDEYLGLDRYHPQSYHTFMVEQLFSHINILKENIHIPDGIPISAEDECKQYEALIERIGPVNLQLLGIGVNGHIGFNEPGTDPNLPTHVVELESATRQSNARFFENQEDVPTQAITMGIKSILKSEQIILLASGRNKAEAVKQLMTGIVSEDFPASYLWTHENVTLLVDKDAYELVQTERQ